MNEMTMARMGRDVSMETMKQCEAARMLTAAIGRDDKDAVEGLVAAGADVNGGRGRLDGDPSLIMALKSSSLRAFWALVGLGADLDKRTKAGNTVLMEAARRGNADMARRLLSAGARVDSMNDNDQTALHFAVTGGDAETVGLFAVKGLLDAPDEGGVRALMMASATGSEEIVGLLLGRGASADAMTYNGGTALHFAALVGSPGVAERLLGASRLWDEPSVGGTSPLMCACKGGVSESGERQMKAREEVARLLLDKGAGAERRGEDGWTSMDFAVKGRNGGLVRLLFERGAKIGRRARRVAKEDLTGGMTALLDGLSLSKTVRGMRRKGGVAGPGSV